MTAPERICLLPDDGWSWVKGPKPPYEENATEYVHADLAAVRPAQIIEIDLRAAMMDELEKAASESPWVPENYYMNEVISDCCAFLRSDRPQPDPRDEVIARLVEAVEMMRSTYPYNPPCYGWQEQVEAHKTAKAALAAAKEMQQKE